MAQYFQYPGPAGVACQKNGLSNTAVIPASARLVITAGQAGVDLKTGELITSSSAAQISAAFDCVDAALKTAGVKDGLSSAHKIVSYLLDPRLEPLMMEVWRARFPEHRPTWTAIGVSGMCATGMICEIQGEAILV